MKNLGPLLMLAALIILVARPAHAGVSEEVVDVAQRAGVEALGGGALSASVSAENHRPVRTVTLAGRLVAVPRGCASVERGYDAVVHFHGAPSAVESAYARSGLSAVLLVINLGLGSGPYENRFQDPEALDRQLAALDRVVKKLCPGSGNMNRLALSAWSAGYGAIIRILGHESAANRVDAVLLSDGMHAAFEPVGVRQVSAVHMESFTRFAERAAAGEKLFAITHSSIVTPDYASTTETASYLIEKQGIERSEPNTVEPRPAMTSTSRASRGGFSVAGYAGTTPEAHADHLHALGDTLFPLLQARWQ